MDLTNNIRNVVIAIFLLTIFALLIMYVQQELREEVDTVEGLKERIYVLEEMITQYEKQNNGTCQEISLSINQFLVENSKSKTTLGVDLGEIKQKQENGIKQIENFLKRIENFEQKVDKYKEDVINVMQQSFEETEFNLVSKFTTLLNNTSIFESLPKQNEISSSETSPISLSTSNTENNNKETNEQKNEHFVSFLVPISGLMGAYLRPIFCTYMQAYLEKQIGKNYEIIFAEQADKLPFNRAYAINIAAIFSNPISDYYVIHDVDLFPFPTNNYSYFNGAAKMNRYFCNYFNFRTCDQTPTKDFFGGVVKMTKKYFEAINGLSNSFWGWGGEDEEFGMRIEQQKSSGELIDLISYHWHVEGIKPENQSREKEMQTEDHQNNYNLILASMKDRNRKFSDGLKQAKAHVEHNSTDFVVFYPLDEFDNSCKLVRFEQNLCRKNISACT